MTQEKNNYSAIQTVAVLAIKTLAYVYFVNSATLSYLIAEFPQYDATIVKLFSTIPMLMMILCTPLNGWLLQHFSIKKIVVACGVVMTLSGFLTYFVHSLPLILVLRVIFGVSYGVSFPMGNGIIQELYDGAPKAKMLGYSSAVGSLFGAAITMVGGWLTAMNWRNCFIAYLLCIPITLIVAIFCPSNTPVRKVAASADSNAKEKMYTPKTWLVLAVVAIITVCMMQFSVELSIVMTGEGIGDATAVSTVSSTNTLLAFFAGLFFGSLQIRAKRYMAAIAPGLMGIGLALLCIVQSTPLFILAAAIFGLGFGLHSPSYVVACSSTTTKPEYGSHAITLFTCATGLGSFFSTWIIAGVKGALGLSFARSEWIIAATVMIAMAVCVAVYVTVTGGNKQKAAA